MEPSNIEIDCPQCGSEMDATSGRCSRCDGSFSDVSLYKPSHFVLLAFLLSAWVPIYLAALNWGRLGNPQAKRRLLLAGFLGFVALFSLLMFLPISAGPSYSKFFGHLINPTIGWLLMSFQETAYARASKLGAKNASTTVGSIRGLGFLLLAMAIPIVGFSVGWTFMNDRATALLQEDECEEAAVVFERLLRWDETDTVIRYNLGLSYACLERWGEAVENFEEYLEENGGDSEAHAFLGWALDNQGHSEQAEAHYATAEELEPGILDRLSDSD
jgi:tetratricopeptide (TPR) repeat protein